MLTLGKDSIFQEGKEERKDEVHLVDVESLVHILDIGL